MSDVAEPVPALIPWEKWGISGRECLVWERLCTDGWRDRMAGKPVSSDYMSVAYRDGWWGADAKLSHRATDGADSLEPVTEGGEA